MATGAHERLSALPPRLSAVHLTLLLEKAEAMGESADRMLQKCNVSFRFADLKAGRVEALSICAFAQIRQLCVNEIRALISPPGVKILTREDYDLMCHALISSATLREVLDRQTRLSRMCDHRYGRSHFETAHGSVRFVSVLGPVEAEWSPFFAVNTLMVYINFFDWLIGNHIPAAFELAVEPTEEALRIANTFGIEVKFRSPSDAIIFPEAYLDKAVVRQVTELNQLLRSYPFDAVVPIKAEASLSARVEAIYRDGIAKGRFLPNLVDIAEMMGMSSATLRRRLDFEGNSLREIKDHVRACVAREMLASNNVRLDDIAHTLGLSSAKILSRSFVKWTGMTIAAYRETSFARHAKPRRSASPPVVRASMGRLTAVA